MPSFHCPCLPALFWALAGCTANARSEEDFREKLSVTQLERKIGEIDAELEKLAHFTLRGGVGAIGYRSMWYREAEHPEWIEIRLEKEYPIDQVVLVPSVWRDPKYGFEADAFPREFVIRAGVEGDATGRIIARHRDKDGSGGGIAPLVIPGDGKMASWIRLEVDRLPLRKFDKNHVIQLAEMLVFSGMRNVALHKAPIISSTTTASGGWEIRNLTDGFVPYLMDSAQGEPSVAYLSPVGKLPTLEVDLGASHALTRIHLHAVDQGDTVPQSYSGNPGIPPYLRIEGALQPDFSDAILLVDYQREDLNRSGPILMWDIPEMTCRYVRVIPRADKPADHPDSRERLGFAEIELIAGGRDVALGKEFTSIPKNPRLASTLHALTDGSNQNGTILPVRTWLEQLARREVLESRRAILSEDLAMRYAKQKTHLLILSWVAAALLSGILALFLIHRNIRRREQAQMSDRFAADLHDELGANLHTVRLLGTLAKDSVDSREDLIELLDRSTVFTERSIDAVRNCTNMLEAGRSSENLAEDMKRASRRLLYGIEHEISFEGEAELRSLKPRARMDLFFFYNECLVNIIRHSGATHVVTRLVASKKSIELSVTDNGTGTSFPDPTEHAPFSLSRRARLLGARITTGKAPAGAGTCITLVYHRRLWGIFS
ncbi:MAG: ATP-binding protein [Luteolibacter sp.]